jgi:hypothetical protein
MNTNCIRLAQNTWPVGSSRFHNNDRSDFRNNKGAGGEVDFLSRGAQIPRIKSPLRLILYHGAAHL